MADESDLVGQGSDARAPKSLGQRIRAAAKSLFGPPTQADEERATEMLDHAERVEEKRYDPLAGEPRPTADQPFGDGREINEDDPIIKEAEGFDRGAGRFGL